MQIHFKIVMHWHTVLRSYESEKLKMKFLVRYGQPTVQTWI